MTDTKEESNLVKHARRELELLGEEQSTIDWYLKVVEAFVEFGHSGGSASVTIPTLHMLLSYENLTPLTDAPEEWFLHEEAISGVKSGLWQNVRNGKAFSYDGGKTYYLIDDQERKFHHSKTA